MEQKQSKYRVLSSDGTNSSIRGTGMNQRTTSNQFNEFGRASKSPASYEGTHGVHYDRQPPTHMLNEEI